MTDYLWDKSGEPDPEIQRLEHLLGGFAHRPGKVPEIPRRTLGFLWQSRRRC